MPDIEQLRAELASARAGDEQLQAEVAELRAELAEARRVQAPLAESQITSSLPLGWEQFTDKNGRYLYVNHGTKQRSRMDPRLGGYASPTFDENFPGEKAGAPEATSQENNMEKEKCIQELRMEIATSSELIKDLRTEIDALCQGLEKVTSENQTANNEFQTVLAILQKENIAKDEQRNELMLSSNAKEELTAELDALRSLHGRGQVRHGQVPASGRDPPSIEREVIKELSDLSSKLHVAMQRS